MRPRPLLIVLAIAAVAAVVVGVIRKQRLDAAIADFAERHGN
jgi:hypothetical protein